LIIGNIIKEKKMENKDYYINSYKKLIEKIEKTHYIRHGFFSEHTEIMKEIIDHLNTSIKLINKYEDFIAEHYEDEVEIDGDKIEELENEIKKLKNKIKEQNKQIDKLNNTLYQKDNEIEELSGCH
jgi:predicted RNase H-like nuclease (RuvC/YqgF family)